MMNTDKVYFGFFDDRDDMLHRFEAGELDPNSMDVRFAIYGDTYGYSGSAHVLFVRDGKLYEVNGSHCSCYGLEGQWYPEETSVEAIRARHCPLRGATEYPEDYDAYNLVLDKLASEGF